MDPECGGSKFDSGKPRIDLVPPEAVFAVAEVLTYGAEKYGERNWERGFAPGRLYAAAMRHMLSCQAGEVRDRESGMPHMWHALATLAMLVALAERGNAEPCKSGHRGCPVVSATAPVE